MAGAGGYDEIILLIQFCNCAVAERAGFCPAAAQFQRCCNIFIIRQLSTYGLKNRLIYAVLYLLYAVKTQL